MYPGILLVCDPRPGQAQLTVAGMLDAIGGLPDGDAGGFADRSRFAAVGGETWAAAAVSPQANEPGRGADVHNDGRDALIWAGEVFLPSAWPCNHAADKPRGAISRAILGQLQTSGVDALADVDGSFCGAWFDHCRCEWVVFTDKLGLIPVFYAAGADRLIVGPKAWLTWQAVGEPLIISPVGVTDLLRCENMVDEHTLIRGVNWLKGGHVLQWSPGHRRTRRYWDFRYADGATCSQEEAADYYLSVMGQTMRRHAACQAPLLVGISGGLDSRMLLGLCRQLGRIPACFTAGWAFSDDVRYGRAAARTAGAPWEWVPLDSKGLPDRLTDAIVATDGLHNVGHMAPISTIHAYLRSRPGAVLLDGYMQGVLGGAYVPADEDVPASIAPHETHWARYRLHGGGDPATIDGLLSPAVARESLERWQHRIDEVYREAPADDPLAKAEYTVASARSGRVDVLGTAMARDDTWVRCPACDRLLLDWHAATPPRVRRGKTLFMEIIRRQFPKLARVQRTAYSGLPVAEDRWLREYCWQKERLHRLWMRWRYPWTRKHGTGGYAIRAWTFSAWRETGGLDMLLAPNARVLEWVLREPLMQLWSRAVREPLEAVPVLALATLETMIRYLERLRPGLRAAPDRVGFRRLELVDESHDSASAAGEHGRAHEIGVSCD